MRPVPEARDALSEFGKIDLLINNAVVRPHKLVEGYGYETTGADVWASRAVIGRPGA